MDSGGEASENESRNRPFCAPATPPKPNFPGIMRFSSSSSAARGVGEEEVNSNEISSADICKPIVDLIDNWKEYSFQELLQRAEAGNMPPAIASAPNNTCDPAVNRRVSYEISAPHQLPYDLNLTPENNFRASFGMSIPKFAPVTPNKLMRADNSVVEDTTHREREKENTTTLENVLELDTDKEEARPSGDSLLAANPTELQENQNPEKLDSSAIDLKKTPQQKERRKKHRPKVITEGKPRTPKQVTPKTTDSKKNPTTKRKYVRKNAKEKASETPSEVAGQCEDSKAATPRKRTCRKALNFEDMEEEHEDSRYSSLDANLELQAHRFCTRSVSKLTIELCKGIEEVAVGKMQEQSTYESVAQGSLARGTQTCPMTVSDSDSSSTVNLTEGQDQAKEFKGNYSHAIKQANAGRITLNGAHYNSVQAYQLISWQNNTRKRTDKGLNNVASSATVFNAEKYIGPKVMASNDDKVSPAFLQVSKGFHDAPQTNGRIIIDLSPNTRPTKKRSRSTTRARNWASLTRIEQQPKSCIDALIAETRATLARKSRTKKRNSLAFQNPALYSDQQSYSRFSGVLSKAASRKMFSVDEIEKQLKCLDINKESSRFVCRERNAIVPFAGRYQEHNALVPYGRDGSMVPFEHVKKPRPRAKVDLDEETTRVWKLLLENINSEGIDGTDENKAKWWEEERKVFRGRANSFIARMHLVQGDRRFSRWKGSVLDSVVGVFLTQNVSDHLSSSAFMSLAARFPLKSRNHGKACIVSELEPCISENTLNQPVGYSSFSPRDAEDNEKTDINKQETYGSYTVEHYTEWEGKAAASLISLHQCVEFSASQTCDKTGSCSESNSDAEDQPNRGKPDSLEESALLLENQSTNQSFIIPEVYCKSGETSSDLKLKENGIESKATENDKNGQKMDKADPKITLESSKEPASGHRSCEIVNAEVSIIESFGIFREETQSSDVSEIKTESSACDQSSVTVEFGSQNTIENQTTTIRQEAPSCPREPRTSIQAEKSTLIKSQERLIENSKNFEALSLEKHNVLQQNLPNYSEKVQVVVKDTTESHLDEIGHSFSKEFIEIDATTSKPKSRGGRKDPKDKRDWDELRKHAEAKGKRERKANTMDSLDWEAVRCANVNEIADTIKERGMNNKLAERIQEFLNRLVREHGSTDLEWLRDVPPDQAKEYLLSMRGLGLKSVECVRLLTLHHLAFPVDTNVGRIAVRLGWVPLQPLPESLQLHLLELYPVLESIQKYLWPRLCKLDQRTLYELHYQMITFGKVFCTKNKPNCNSCPMRGECRHFASAFASARLALPGPEEKSIVIATEKGNEGINHTDINKRAPLPLPQATGLSKQDQQLVATHKSEAMAGGSYCEPIIEEPATPEPECTIGDIEDDMFLDDDEIPTIRLDSEAFTENVHNYMQQNMELRDCEMSKALVALDPQAASIPMPKLKNVNRLRTEHQVYELPDEHPLLEMLQMEKREPDDPSPYLLAIWTPGETVNSIEPPAKRCRSQGLDKLCNDEECFSCNSVREANSQTVRGTILIPCRTAMRGSFPLNGTYFQVNEVFADNDSSLNPIDIPRALLWNLPRRTVYFGTSIPTIFRGLTTQGIQLCFWRGYVCVRGFDQKSRAPRPLVARLHFPASKGKRTRDPKTDE